jgi:hypothetical protein
MFTGWLFEIVYFGVRNMIRQILMQYFRFIVRLYSKMINNKCSMRLNKGESPQSVNRFGFFDL